MYSKFNCIYPDINIGVYSRFQYPYSYYSRDQVNNKIYTLFADNGINTAGDFKNHFSTLNEFIDYVKSIEDFPNLMNSHLPDLSDSEYPQSIISFQRTYFPADIRYYDLSNLKMFNDRNSESLPLYPIATRSVIDNDCIIVERSPFKISGSFKPAGSNRSSSTQIQYEFWVPWTLTVLYKDYQKAAIYFGSSSVDSPDAKYIHCILPNIYGDSSVCFNSSLREYNLSSNQDFRSYFYSVINEYYSGGWNTDLYSTYLSFLNSHFFPEDEDYSFAIKNFITPDRSHYKNLTASKFDALKRRAAKYDQTHSTATRYKYLFEVLSSYDLKNTLDFYADLAKMAETTPGIECLTFDDIVDKTRSNRARNVHNDLLSKIETYTQSNTIHYESYPDYFPKVTIHHKNAYYPYLEAFYDIFQKFHDTDRLFFDMYSIYSQSDNLFDATIQDPFTIDTLEEIYTRIFYDYYNDNYSSSSNHFYFDIDHETSHVNEYPDLESYQKYLFDYHQTLTVEA